MRTGTAAVPGAFDARRAGHGAGLPATDGHFRRRPFASAHLPGRPTDVRPTAAHLSHLFMLLSGFRTESIEDFTIGVRSDGKTLFSTISGRTKGFSPCLAPIFARNATNSIDCPEKRAAWRDGIISPIGPALDGALNAGAKH